MKRRINCIYYDSLDGIANEVDKFGEILVAKYYGEEQLPASNKSADIKTS